MKKNYKAHNKARIVPIALLSALMLGNTVTAFAATGKTNFTFPKTIVMDASEAVPDVTFNMTVTAGTVTNGEYVRTGMESQTGSGQAISRLTVYPGVDAAKVKVTSGNKSGVAGASFSSSTTATKGDIGTDGKVTASTDKKFVTDNMTIDFSGVNFTEPGVYRYILTESDVSGYTADITNTQGTKKQRIIEVYVENNSAKNGVEITGYVVYKVTDGVKVTGDITVGPNKNGTLDSMDVKDTGKVDVNVSDGGVTTGSKSNTAGGFVNKMDSSYYTKASIEVSGNQSSSDKYFKLTYTITGLTPGKTLTVDPSGFSKTPTKNSVTSYDETTMKTANNVTTLTADSNGKISHTFYVKANDYVKLLGFKESDTRDITATIENEDYLPTIKGGSSDAANTANWKQTGGGNTDVTFNLDKTGVIPTGVVLDSAPYIGGIVMAALGGTYLTLKKKKEE